MGKKVTVIVPPREGGFNGWWAAGKRWEPGQYDNVELEDHEIANLARRPGVLVLMGGKTVKPDESAPSNLQTIQVTGDELQAVEQFRREQAKKQTNTSVGYVVGDKEDREDAVSRARAEVTTSISGADTPLMDRDVLRGQPPPSGPGGSDLPPPKPLDDKGHVQKKK